MDKDENPVEWGRSRTEDLLAPVLLTTAADEMEAGVITSLLGSAGIASRCRNKGMGSYMGIVMGSNRFGIEIDVAEKDLELAKSLLEADPEGVIPEEGFVDEADPEADTSECEESDGSEPSVRTSVSPMFWGLLLLGLLVAALALRLLGLF